MHFEHTYLERPAVDEKNEPLLMSNDIVLSI